MNVEPGQVYAYHYARKELLVQVLRPEAPKEMNDLADGPNGEVIVVGRVVKRLYSEGDAWDCLVLHGDNPWGYPAGKVGTWVIDGSWERVA